MYFLVFCKVMIGDVVFPTGPTMSKSPFGCFGCKVMIGDVLFPTMSKSPSGIFFPGFLDSSFPSFRPQSWSEERASDPEMSDWEHSMGA